MTLLNPYRRALLAGCAAAALSLAFVATAFTQDHSGHSDHDGHNHGPVTSGVGTKPTTQPAVGAQPHQPGQPPAPQGTVQLKPGELPKIEFDTPIYDFGRMRTGKDVEHDFWFHNAGNGPLEILQVKPS